MNNSFITIIFLLLGIFIGFSFGYAHCRHLLKDICLNEIGSTLTGRVFGYPIPYQNRKRPTIAELEDILKEDDSEVFILPNGEVVARD